MLSRIFKRGSKGEEESGLPPSTPGKFDEMAVRRSSRIASAQGTPVSEAGSPAIAKKRSAEATASPITQKRQRKLPVRNKDGENDGESHSHFEIVMPLKGNDAGSAANNEEESDGAENEDEQKAIKDSQAEESDEEPEEEIVEEKSSKPKSKSKPSKTKSTKKPSPQPAAEASKPKHKRFGSEEPALDAPSIVEEVVEESGEEEEDSDDDAPEEVGAQEATQAAQKLSRKEAKAAEEKEAELRKKRKEKDTLLKKQAEKKRRAEEALNDVGPQITRQDSKTSEPSTATLTKDPRPVPLNAKFDRSTLPEYLPAEFLEDEDTLMLDEPAQVSLPRPRKIKFSDVYEKKPKDRTVGSTTVRVAEKVDKHLAPKAAKNARSTKEAWLAGRSGRGGGGGDNRRPVSGGFFKNGPAKR